MLWGVVIHTHQTDILSLSEDYKSHLKSANSFKITKNKLAMYEKIMLTAFTYSSV